MHGEPNQRILVDTDVLIEYLRGNRAVFNTLKPLLVDGYACISPLSVYELFSGARFHERDAINTLINAMNILPLSMAVATLAGDRRGTYRAKGITLGDIDCMIATTAISNNIKLWTRNVKHYPDVEIYGLI